MTLFPFSTPFVSVRRMPKRVGSGRLLRSLAAIAVLATTACSGGGEDGGTGSATSVAEGGVAPPEPLVTAEIIDAPALRGAGEHGVIASLHSAGSVTYGAGSVQDLADGTRRPLVVRRGAAAWEPIALDGDAGGAGSAVAAAVIEVGDEVIVLGSGSEGSDADVVAWSLDQPAERLDLRGSVVGDGTQTVTAAAAGPSGVLLAGHRDGVPVLWSSTDARVWEEVDVEPLLDGEQLVDVVGLAVGDAGGIVTVSTRQRSVVLSSEGLQRFAVLDAAAGEQGVRGPVVPVAGGFLVGGGQTAGDGQSTPTVWRTDGTTWPEAGETLPVTDAAGTSNIGFRVGDMDVNGDRVAVSFGYAVVVSDGPGSPWRVLGDEGLPDSTRPDDIAAGAGAVVAETIDDSRTIFSSDGTSWRATTGASVPLPDEVVHPDGVAHRDGTWLVAGTVMTADGTPTLAAWWSDDGRRWTRAESIPGAAGFSATAAGTSSAGFVVAAQSDSGGDAAAWTSPDGRSWAPVESPLLLSESGGVRQIESILPRPDGALLAGYGFDGSVIRPYVLRLAADRTLTQEDVPASSRPQTVTLALCEHDDAVAVVGGAQDERAQPVSWLSGPDGWELAAGDANGSLSACVSVDGALVGLVAASDDGPGVTPLPVTGPPSLLPGDGPFAVEHLAALGRRAVVIGSGVDAAADVRLWISPEGEALEGPGYEMVTPPELGGVAAQHPGGIASDGERLLLAVADGGTVRLVSLTIGGPAGQR